VFDSLETLLTVMPAMAGLLSSMTLNLDRMEAQATAGFSLATDVADVLVQKGVPFRQAHEIVGGLVALCEAEGIDLPESTDAQLASVSEHLTPDIRAVMTPEASVARKSGVGGTAPARVREQRAQLTALIDALQRD
jgi:argininosuccinate lyase